MKHTKGEWIADLRSGCCAVYPKHRKDETNGCHAHDSRNIFFSDKGIMLNEKGYWEMCEETQANAKLIASAPDMLHALECGVVTFGNLETLDNVGRLKEAVKIMKSAIKKATGE